MGENIMTAQYIGPLKKVPKFRNFRAVKDCPISWDGSCIVESLVSLGKLAIKKYNTDNVLL